MGLMGRGYEECRNKEGLGIGRQTWSGFEKSYDLLIIKIPARWHVTLGKSNDRKAPPLSEEVLQWTLRKRDCIKEKFRLCNLRIWEHFVFLILQEQDKLEEKGGIDVHQIRSVKVNRGGSRHIPKAFEIFTDNKSFVLKAKVSET